MPDEGVVVDLADGSHAVGADAANHALGPFGTKVWPIDLASTGADVRALLGLPRLTAAQNDRVRDAFLMSRQRLLEVMSEAGRQPSIPGGGELSTLDVVNDVRYPQLYVVDPTVDYGRFDRLHENVADDGTVLDETMALIWGGPIRLVQRLADGSLATLLLRVVEDSGWLVSYGGLPHIGSLSGAAPGSKVLVQAIGPARWQARYVG